MTPLSIALLAGPLDVTSENVLALDLATALAARGHEVRMFGAAGALLSRFTAAGVPVTPLDLSGRFFLDLPRLGALRREVGTAAPRILHVVDQRLASHGAWLARALGIPWVVTATDPGLASRRPGPAAILAASPAVRHELVQRGGAAVTATAFPLDLARFAPSSGLFRREVPVVGTLTRLDADAAVADLYRATSLLVEAGRSLHMIVAGYGPGEEAARRLSREMNLKGRVTVTTAPRDFEPLLATLDVFVLSRHHEWHGVELIQAFAAGRPAVASGVGAVFSLVSEGENGHIVPRADPAALADAIARLLDDREAAVRMGRAARESVEVRFASGVATERLEGVYSEVVAEAG